MPAVRVFSLILLASACSPRRKRNLPASPDRHHGVAAEDAGGRLSGPGKNARRLPQGLPADHWFSSSGTVALFEARERYQRWQGPEESDPRPRLRSYIGTVLVDQARRNMEDRLMLPPFPPQRSEKDSLIWNGSPMRMREEDLRTVVQSLPPRCRRRLRQLANWLGLDEVSAVVWLSEKTSGPLRGSSEGA